MNSYKITYKQTGSRLDLPEEVVAAGYRTSGRFFEFYDQDGPLVGEILAAISSDLVAYIEMQSPTK